jgi:RND family efflux transporter MFP subunit
VDDSVYELRASVPSARYNALVVGAPVEVTVDAVGGPVAKGRIARIAPLVDERNRSFEVTVEVPHAPGLVGGLFARASVAVGGVAEALVVPPSALVRGGGEAGTAALFVVQAGTARRREVRVGVEQPDAVQVLAGVAAGEQVVVDPPAPLTDGSPVEPQAARAAAAR